MGMVMMPEKGLPENSQMIYPVTPAIPLHLCGRYIQLV
jgi:hypothetical protein